MFLGAEGPVRQLPRTFAAGQVGEGDFRVTAEEFRPIEVARDQRQQREQEKWAIHFLGAGGRVVTGTNFWARSV